MSWWKRKGRVPVQNDIGEARELRAEAKEQIAELNRQAPMIRKMTQRIINRGVANHFGDSIQITFVRK